MNRKQISFVPLSEYLFDLYQIPELLLLPFDDWEANLFGFDILFFNGLRVIWIETKGKDLEHLFTVPNKDSKESISLSLGI